MLIKRIRKRMMTGQEIEKLNTLKKIARSLSDISDQLRIQNTLLQKLIQNDEGKEKEKEKE